MRTKIAIFFLFFCRSQNTSQRSVKSAAFGQTPQRNGVLQSLKPRRDFDRKYASTACEEINGTDMNPTFHKTTDDESPEDVDCCDCFREEKSHENRALEMAEFWTEVLFFEWMISCIFVTSFYVISDYRCYK